MVVEVYPEVEIDKVEDNEVVEIVAVAADDMTRPDDRGEDSGV